MELWQGLPPEVRRDYAVVRTVKCTAEKELVLLQRRADGLRVLLRNYPEEAPAVYALLAGRELPHMPRILACEAREGGGYVLEEFIEGRCLGDGPLLEPQHALRVLRQTCEALAALHALGVVHRDVKPENLLETPDGQVYLLDFDAARQYKSHVEKDTCTLGTTGYAAPEQFGIVQTDQRADIFALGVTLNVLATGCHPSQKLCRAPLRHIVLKCTRIDPRARYQTAQAVRRACAPRLLWLRCTAGPARVRSVRMAALCACAVFSVCGLHTAAALVSAARRAARRPAEQRRPPFRQQHRAGQPVPFRRRQHERFAQHILQRVRLYEHQLRFFVQRNVGRLPRHVLVSSFLVFAAKRIKAGVLEHNFEHIFQCGFIHHRQPAGFVLEACISFVFVKTGVFFVKTGLLIFETGFLLFEADFFLCTARLVEQSAARGRDPCGHCGI